MVLREDLILRSAFLGASRKMRVPFCYGSSSPTRRNPANLAKSGQALPSLDFPGPGAMFRATFGKSSRQMRNKITKLLIVVVPRRTAGDG